MTASFNIVFVIIIKAYVSWKFRLTGFITICELKNGIFKKKSAKAL